MRIPSGKLLILSIIICGNSVIADDPTSLITDITQLTVTTKSTILSTRTRISFIPLSPPDTTRWTTSLGEPPLTAFSTVGITTIRTATDSNGVTTIVPWTYTYYLLSTLSPATGPLLSTLSLVPTGPPLSFSSTSTLSVTHPGPPSPTVTFPSTRSSLTSTSTQSTSSSSPTITVLDNLDVKKSNGTAVFAGILTPILFIAMFLVVYFVRKVRKRRKYAQDANLAPQPRISQWSSIITGQKNSPKDLRHNIPMVDRGPHPHPFRPVPPIPPRSPERLTRTKSPPIRSDRAESLSESLISTLEVMDRLRTPPLDYLHETQSEQSVTPFDSSSQRGGSRYSEIRPRTPPNMVTSPTKLPGSTSPISPTKQPKAYDGTRNRFYEEALNRNLPFSELTRPSLRIPNSALARDNGRGKSLTPEPLKIVKRNASDEGVGVYMRPAVSGSMSDGGQYQPPTGGRSLQRGITPTERGLRGIMEQPHHEPGYATSEPIAGPSRQHQHTREEEHDKDPNLDLMHEDSNLDLMNDTEVDEDEEERRAHGREYTLQVLEGSVHMPRRPAGCFFPGSRTSSVYDDEMREEMAERRERELDRDRQLDLERASEVDRKGEGKGKGGEHGRG